MADGVNFNNEKDVLIKSLDKYLSNFTCVVCKTENAELLIVPGYINQPLQETLDNYNIGGPSLPTVSVVCKTCGYIYQFARGPLASSAPESGDTEPQNGKK